MELRAIAPAKMILSGEHAVLYGQPAIAMAINRYSESTIRTHLLPAIFFNFLNLKYKKSVTLSTLFNLKHELQQQYSAFLEGRCGIKEVLKKPFELLQFTVTDFLEKCNINLPNGVEIQTTSDIPMGCGMGSSAATVVSTLYALAKFFKIDIDPVKFLNLGKNAENLQHGRSSGLDLQLSLSGGCLKFQDGQIEPKSMPTSPFTIVQTGQPKSTTGQCVTLASTHFQTTKIGEDFAAVTTALEKALFNHDSAALKHCIQENHRLLIKIGVVPTPVQDFVKLIEREGGAAKICGAGAVQGDHAGIVWVLLSDDRQRNNRLQEITRLFGYHSCEVQGEKLGVRLVSD